MGGISSRKRLSTEEFAGRKNPIFVHSPEKRYCRPREIEKNNRTVSPLRAKPAMALVIR